VVTSAITTENAHQFGKNVTARQTLDVATCLQILQIGHRTKGKLRLYEGKIPAMTQDYGTGGQNIPLIANALLPIGYRRIRRLTPRECERLQGFPDNWTEGISDTQRYKCLGNAVTVNVIEAIGRAFIKGQIGDGDTF